MFLLQLSKKVFFYWVVNTDKPNFVSFLFFVGTAIMFSAKQHSDCGHWWPEIQLHNADGLFQTGNQKKKCRQVEFERQAIRTMAMRSALRLCLHTVNRTLNF